MGNSFGKKQKTQRQLLQEYQAINNLTQNESTKMSNLLQEVLDKIANWEDIHGASGGEAGEKQFKENPLIKILKDRVGADQAKMFDNMFSELNDKSYGVSFYVLNWSAIFRSKPRSYKLNHLEEAIAMISITFKKNFGFLRANVRFPYITEHVN